ncbi:hypothetical protein K469DRAFT_718120 [Zopfia rhizophila CBS 207.26]|uniref:DUF7730 domain-containing protein n=1 Tax=Zopfia rhizophila CBS 207.26 TaxID=1314779 RepID=A0A6A6DLU8_9PEZI|nr:hypothetical protein K469DRAFT_718120 [Zopfia rhizophila CBS 207.26]
MSRHHSNASKPPVAQSNMSGRLLSCPKAMRRTSRKIRGFLGLPGELRNSIYSFYFEGEFHVEIAAPGTNFTPKEPNTTGMCLATVNKDSQIYKHHEKKGLENISSTLRMPRKLGRYTRVDGGKTNWTNSLSALILVCSQVHTEVIALLYSNTTFAFAAPRRIMNFLEVLPKQNLALITKLHLHYATYNCPYLSSHVVWQDKHTACWSDTCKHASRKLVNLQELQFWLHVTVTPLYFDLCQYWIEPLLHFRRLTRSRTAKDNASSSISDSTRQSFSIGPLDIKIHFSTYYNRPFIFSHSRLADACADLHRLFAEAIRRRVMGWAVEDAMVDYREAWVGKYSEWQHHLNFSPPGR